MGLGRATLAAIAGGFWGEGAEGRRQLRARAVLKTELRAKGRAEHGVVRHGQTRGLAYGWRPQDFLLGQMCERKRSQGHCLDVDLSSEEDGVVMPQGEELVGEAGEAGGPQEERVLEAEGRGTKKGGCCRCGWRINIGFSNMGSLVTPMTSVLMDVVGQIMTTLPPLPNICPRS